MNIRSAFALILCVALACGVNATPIQYTQIGDASHLLSNGAASSGASAEKNKEAARASLAAESQDQPEFVRLGDGRLVPYGPGVICSDVCVEEVAQTPPGMSRRWLIAIPIAGAAIAAVLLASGDSSLPRPPTNVGGVSQDPTPTPTPNPNPTPTPNPCGSNCSQPEPVPEPGTIALLGAGLALLSRKRIVAVFKRTQA